MARPSQVLPPAERQCLEGCRRSGVIFLIQSSRVVVLQAREAEVGGVIGE